MIAAFMTHKIIHRSAMTTLAPTNIDTAKRFLTDTDTLKQIARDVLNHARAQGASDCEVDVSEGFGYNVTVRQQAVETIEYNRDKGLGVAVYLGQKKGYASSSVFSAQALRDTVDAALNIARFTAEDPCAGLAEQELLAFDYADPDLYHPWPIAVEEAIEQARQCEQGALDNPAITNSEGASLSTQEAHFISANSAGFMGGFPTSRHCLSASVIAGQGDGMQRDDWYSMARAAQQLESPAQVGRIAAQRAAARLNSRKIATGTYPVIFEVPIAATLINSLVHAASGGVLYRKASFLLDKLGQKICAPCVHIEEKPHLPGALGSSPFDSDGVRTKARTVVDQGVLAGYFLSVYSGRKLNLPSTGNAGGSHNLIVRSTGESYEELIKTMDKGLIVTELLGHGINYVTGDYSRGAAGFWVENGVIVHPVEEITIAGNLQEMFLGIQAIANNALVLSPKQCGAVFIDHMTIGS